MKQNEKNNFLFAKFGKLRKRKVVSKKEEELTCKFGEIYISTNKIQIFYKPIVKIIPFKLK